LWQERHRKEKRCQVTQRQLPQTTGEGEIERDGGGGEKERQQAMCYAPPAARGACLLPGRQAGGEAEGGEVRQEKLHVAVRNK